MDRASNLLQSRDDSDGHDIEFRLSCRVRRRTLSRPGIHRASAALREHGFRGKYRCRDSSSISLRDFLEAIAGAVVVLAKGYGNALMGVAVPGVTLTVVRFHTIVSSFFVNNLELRRL